MIFACGFSFDLLLLRMNWLMVFRGLYRHDLSRALRRRVLPPTSDVNGTLPRRRFFPIDQH